MLINKGIAKFVESLHDRMERKEILADLKATYDHLHNRVLPLYELEIKLTPRKNVVASELESMLRRTKAKSMKTPLDTLREVLINISNNEGEIAALIEKSIGSLQLKQALDYKAINTLYYVESLNYFVNYAHKAFNACVSEEVELKDICELSPLDKRTRLEVLSAEALLAVSKIVDVMLLKVGDFEKKLEGVDGVLYNENDYETLRHQQGPRFDPMGFGFIPLWLHLPYHMALKFNELEALNIQKAEQEKMRVQFMIQALKEKEERALTDEEKEKHKESIKYYNNLLNRLDQKIERYENS